MLSIVFEVLGNPKWTEKLEAARDKYHGKANIKGISPNESNRFRLMGDRANALANRNKLNMSSDENMKQLVKNHYKLLTLKMYPSRMNKETQ
jgi:hypothetical protein